VTLSEGFDRFEPSTTAPAATDWCDPLSGGNCTHWESAPWHGALSDLPKTPLILPILSHSLSGSLRDQAEVEAVAKAIETRSW